MILVSAHFRNDDASVTCMQRFRKSVTDTRLNVPYCHRFSPKSCKKRAKGTTCTSDHINKDTFWRDSDSANPTSAHDPQQERDVGFLPGRASSSTPFAAENDKESQNCDGRWEGAWMTFEKPAPAQHHHRHIFPNVAIGHSGGDLAGSTLKLSEVAAVVD